MESAPGFAAANPAPQGKRHIALRGQRVIAIHLAVLILCALWGGGLASAQSNDDGAGWQKFVDGVGAAVYKFAWPTATYQSVGFEGISRTADGVDVKIRVRGISAFDDGPLWTDVILQVRNGKIDDIRWGANNAVLAAPGETMKALGALLVELNKEYGRDHPATAPDQTPPDASPNGPTPAPDQTSPEGSPAAVCLSNPTKQTISYTLRIEGRSENHTLDPGKEQLSWTRTVVPQFAVSFDDSFEDGYTDRTIQLPAEAVVGTPTTCDDDMTYEFVVDGQKIGLAPRKWLPGFEHPFVANVLRAQKEGDWVCAPGQKWASSDPESIECIPNDVGLLGITIKLQDGDQYPQIVSVAKGGAAEQAGVPSGPYLLSVDGVSLEGLSLSDVVAKLRGPMNSTVRIAISAADGPPRVIELQRQ